MIIENQIDLKKIYEKFSDECTSEEANSDSFYEEIIPPD